MLKNISYVYTSNIINGLLGLFVIPLGIHQLGLPGYGLFSIYLIFVNYNQFFELGMSKNLSRHLAQANCDAKKLEHLQTAASLFFLICCGLLILAPLIIYVASHYLFPVPQALYRSLQIIILLSLVDYILSIPTNIAKAYCVAQEQFKQYSQFTVFSGLARYGLMIIGFVGFRSIAVVVLVAMSYRLVDMFFAQRLMLKLPRHYWKLHCDFKKIKAMFGQSLFLSSMQLSQTIMLSVGSILTNYFFGLATLGLYQAAFNIANKLWFFSNGIGLVIFPRFAKYLTQSKEQHAQLLDSLNITLRFSWLGYLVIGLIASYLTPLLLAVLHLQQPQIPQLLCLLFVAIAMNSHSDISFNYLQAALRYQASTLLIAAAIGCMVLLFLLLRPYLGVLAMGWAWVISQFFYAYFIDAMVVTMDFKTVGWKLATALMASVILLSKQLQHFNHAADVLSIILLVGFFIVLVKNYAALKRIWIS